MHPSSRTPEGDSFKCRVCGENGRIECSPVGGDATCPRCGSLIWPKHRRLQPSAKNGSVFANAARMSNFDSLSEFCASAKESSSREEIGECLVKVLHEFLAAYGVTLWWLRRRWWIGRRVLRADYSSGEKAQSRQFAESVLSEPGKEFLAFEDHQAKVLRIGVPVLVDAETCGVIEVLQRHGARPTTQSAYVRFIRQAIEIVKTSKAFSEIG